MELTDLDRFNPWWKTGKVKEDLLKDYKRKLYPKISEYVDKKQILLIQGLRRVGKTVIMFQLIQNQLKKTKPDNILYFSFDEVAYDLKDVLKIYQEMILGKTFEKTKDKIYLFLDEIQKVDDWENKLKVFYDLYPNLKIFISGSSSINLRKNSRESLAGRLFSFTLHPLEFDEFLELNGMDIKKIRAKPELWKRDILPMFYRYIKFGGFPELATEKNENFARDYILNSVIEKIIYNLTLTVCP
ncbi:MAG: AAA family ATPase, partial [Candidatus Aenigmarchaeota archaeon]|nr:AAA family ATPase [Candidatus Aenigmarchaeota archaeon]